MIQQALPRLSTPENITATCLPRIVKYVPPFNFDGALPHRDRINSLLGEPFLEVFRVALLLKYQSETDLVLVVVHTSLDFGTDSSGDFSDTFHLTSQSRFPVFLDSAQPHCDLSLPVLILWHIVKVTVNSPS